MSPDDDEVDPLEPHPECPTNDDGQPVHPEKDIPICGVPKTVDDNRYPFCTNSTWWVFRVGRCFEHLDRTQGDGTIFDDIDPTTDSDSDSG